MSVRLAFEALKNTRDLGGMRTMDGHTIRPGLLIRSGNLALATEGDLARLVTMVDTAADFRTDKERAEHPDPEIPGVRFIHLPVIDSLSAGVTRDADSDEAAMRILMQSGEDAREYMRNTYRQFAEAPAALNGYAAFVRLLAGTGTAPSSGTAPPERTAPDSPPSWLRSFWAWIPRTSGRIIFTPTPVWRRTSKP